MLNKKIKVLIVDDSALVRQVLSKILNEDEEIEVIDTASDPHYAAQKINYHVPDVITLDIEMPRMDGLTFLKKIMKQHPIPVVVISSYTSKGSTPSIKAMEYGAIETILKPNFSDAKKMEESAIIIRDAVKAASQANIRNFYKLISSNLEYKPVKSQKKQFQQTKQTDKIILMGASTGGTEAIKIILKDLPADFPAVLIVLHMPEGFTASFANRLNEICPMYVKEAENGESVTRGKVLIAKGNRHLLLRYNYHGYYVELNDGPLIYRHKPSVNALFESASPITGKNATAVLLTGMGKDGAQGLLELRQKNVFTIAQDEKSSIVYGMPCEAKKIGAANKIVPLNNISETLKQIITGNFR